METGKEGSESGEICGTGEMRDRRDAGKVRYSAVISSMSRFLLYCVNNSQKANKKFKKEKEDIHEMRMQIWISNGTKEQCFFVRCCGFVSFRLLNLLFREMRNRISHVNASFAKHESPRNKEHFFAKYETCFA